MIDLIFQKGIQIIDIKINGSNLTFAEVKGQMLYFAPIDRLNWNLACVIDKWPDLKDKNNEEVKAIAIQRFKEHLKTFKTEIDIIQYLKEDLKPHGYILKLIKRKGYRPKIVKND